MDAKNAIIYKYAMSLVDAANSIVSTVSTMNDKADENSAVIKIVNVLLESLRSQTVLMQQSVDDYN